MPLDKPTPDVAAAPSSPHSAFRAPRFLWPSLKWALFLVVLAFVGRHAWRLWRDFDSQSLQLRWGWLTAATLLSVLCWLPSYWFWRRLLAELGQRPPTLPLLRAYFCGHPAKYVPGKAMVMATRAALLSEEGVPVAATLYTVPLETLTYMGAGVVTMALLLPTIATAWPQWRALAESPAIRIGIPLIAVPCSLGGLGLLSWMSARLVRRVGAIPSTMASIRPIPVRTFAAGLAVAMPAWWMQGALLGLTLQGLSPNPVSWSDWPLWTGASAVSLVGGFLAVFAPGGLGVREGLLMALLERQVGPHEAVAAAVVLRAVTLVGECSLAAALYAWPRSRAIVPSDQSTGGLSR